ncbi:MAG TPA: inositol monophosphatase [Chloroflexi bacterium]|jgi:myo-inositol-1(or 4)-monophosphatase|nr:inositol monophosphatase [Chloroflexota bacterium]
MLETAIRAAREAGAVLRRGYLRPHEVRVKGYRDIMTEVDLAAERVAVGIVREAFPDATIMSEESYTRWQHSGDEPAWFIDPLDGTTNYARGLPMFSVSVGVALGGVPQCGAVYDPLLDQLFWAERGVGAFLGDTRLRVSERATLSETLVTLDWPREQRMREVSARFLARLAPRVDAVRSRGSAALGLCAIAAGWADIYFQYTLSPWDVAAGALIVEEAGGRVTDLHGRPYRLDEPGWLATNGRVHDAVLALEPYREE